MKNFALFGIVLCVIVTVTADDAKLKTATESEQKLDTTDRLTRDVYYPPPYNYGRRSFSKLIRDPKPGAKPRPKPNWWGVGRANRPFWDMVPNWPFWDPERPPNPSVSPLDIQFRPIAPIDGPPDYILPEGRTYRVRTNAALTTSQDACNILCPG